MKAVERTKASARELGENLEDRIRARPLSSLGVALGAGFVIGGGLTALVTGPLLRAGGGLALRLIILPAVSRGITRALGLQDDDSEGANA
jgi:hypothetical protein